MSGVIISAVGLLLAAPPALLFWLNWRLYRPLPLPPSSMIARPVSILIPARNEEKSIVAAVRAAAASQRVPFEIVVLDDHSDDATACLVAELAVHHPCLRLLHAPALPAGWCGKQHACQVLAQAARYDLLLFVDADVRLAPDALARMAAFLEASGAALISGVPHQETGTLCERLLIPLIHFLLLGFLPLQRMRNSTHPAYAAGCGQLFLARHDAYEKAGGHAAIRYSLHDGLTLPRAFRQAGFPTDLFDATELATCRMYRGAREVWFGLAKNATEGLAKPRLIVPASLLLFGGQVLPLLLLALSPWLSWSAVLLSGLAFACNCSVRLASVYRFRQSLTGALLHPFGITLLVAIQWYALGRSLLGHPANWKGRPYDSMAIFPVK